MLILACFFLDILTADHVPSPSNLCRLKVESQITKKRYFIWTSNAKPEGSKPLLSIGLQTSAICWESCDYASMES